MKKRLWLAALAAFSLIFNVQAELTHRYMLNGSADDTVGIINGIVTADATNTEVPLYAADIPSNTVAAAPAQSMEIGMNYGVKKSGFQLNPTVISTGSGSYSLWLKADVMANGRYMVFCPNLTDGPTLIGQNASQVKLISGDEKSPIYASFSTGVWHHVTATWDNPSGTASFYLDGVLAGTTNFTPNSIQPISVRIGGYDMGDSTSAINNQFEGHLYDIQFYDHALAVEDVEKLYTYPGATVGAEIVAEDAAVLAHRYLFDSDVTDAVGGADGNPTTAGTNLEAPAYTADVPPGTADGAPANSVEVGMNYGTKKSGFAISSSIISTNTGSYSLWMKADVLANGRYIFSPLSTASGPFLAGDSTSSIKIVAGGSTVVSSLSTGAWHHVVASWDNMAGELYVYVDGSLVGSNTFAAGSISPITVRVGGFSLNDDGNNLANQYDGHLYDIQLYEGMLGSADVFDLYTKPGSKIRPSVVVDTPSVLAHRYVFSNDVSDMVGEYNGIVSVDGTNTEAVAYSADVPVGTVAGAPAQSLEVGVNYGAKKSGFSLNHGVVNKSAGSYSLWFKADTMENARYIVSCLPLADGPTLKGQTTTSISGIFGDEKDTVTTTVATGIWHHVAVTWDNPSGSGWLYLDGELVGTASFTSNSITPTAVNIGGFNLADDDQNIANQFEGHFYDMQFYNNMLSSDEVYSLYQNPGSAPDLLTTSNGVPYSWLSTYYAGLVTDADYENAAESDSDGDGYSAKTEYFTRTNPTRDTSFFNLAGAESVTDGFVVTWPSREGAMFSLLTNGNLVVPSWGVMVSNIVGQADETSYTTTVSEVQSFYKVGLE